MKIRGRARVRRSRDTDWAHYVAPASLLIALGATLLVFFVTGNELSDVKALVAITVALLASVLSLQIEILIRIAERARSREEHGKLLEMVEEWPALLPPLAAMAEAAVQTYKCTAIEQFKDEVTSVFSNAEVETRELARGRLRTAAGHNTLMLDLVRSAEATIEGVTDSGDTGWWASAAGRRQFELNKSLLQRNGNVERVWLLRGMPDVATREVIQSQCDAGVSVLVLRSDRLEAVLIVNLTLIDGRFMHEDIVNKHGKTVNYLYSENAADVKRATDTFARLRARATSYAGPETFEQLFSVSGMVIDDELVVEQPTLLADL